MANYSRREDVKKKRPDPDTETRARIEQDLALGHLIYDLRTTAGLSQRELAARMGTTQSVISRLEEGGGAQPPRAPSPGSPPRSIGTRRVVPREGPGQARGRRPGRLNKRFAASRSAPRRRQGQRVGGPVRVGRTDSDRRPRANGRPRRVPGFPRPSGVGAWPSGREALPAKGRQPCGRTRLAHSVPQPAGVARPAHHAVPSGRARPAGHPTAGWATRRRPRPAQLSWFPGDGREDP